MLSRVRIARNLARRTLVSAGRVGSRCLIATRYQSSLRSEPHEILTKLGENDPNRNQFFQYTWGSWIKDDKIEKSKRQTSFSIEGISKIVKDFQSIKSNSTNFDKNGNPIIKSPLQLKDGSYVLSNNLSNDILGESSLDYLIKSIASIHEGKHHRIYKITLSTNKSLILRIPYKLESDFAIEQKIKSEVATLDFLNLKLNLNVPKVVAYSSTRNNCVESPYILMEFIPGNLLMKQWNPLLEDSEENLSKLKSVITPMVEFQNQVNSIEFNKFGSLYFHDDVSISNQSDLPYNNESNPLLKNRWRIGPSVEKVYSKNKRLLPSKVINEYNGPWNASKPEKLIESAIDLEIENIQSRISLSQADSSNKVENIEQLNQQLETLRNFKKIANQLINPKSSAILNVENLFKPRLNIPDLDPLNVILKNENTPYFLDFEYASIKPFIFTSYPAFIEYNGAKIYDLEQDIPEFLELDEIEQQQYKFMYLKTRNERLWESELNRINHDFIAVASPHLKLLKSPYLQLLQLKNDLDYLYIENSLMQLQQMWQAYVSNDLCNSSNGEQFPIKYDQEYVDRIETDLQNYQNEIVSQPFAATGGWVPQDMFANLVDSGIIVEDENGNYKISTEKALQQDEVKEK